MKHQKVVILAVIVLVIALSGVGAFASNASAERMPQRFIPPKPTLSISGNQATCSVTVRAPGKTIDATLELWQGSTLVASWSDCRTGIVVLSETVTVVSGLTYTLTVSGTINGVAFTPQSVTN
ncbi:MAG: hypothetical protein II725_00580 [Firmicutes bacterium]|nr:hypothetical protein [Bacillota bacterium]